MAVEQLKQLSPVDPWPTRKLPQDRFDASVKKSMDQIVLFVVELNGNIVILNKINIRVQENADRAAQSEANAKASENAAKASQTAAKTSETNAKASENAANSSKNAAAASATNAANSATNAANSANAANQHKNAAAASASNAATSATNAANSAAAASNSANTANAHKNAAAASAANAANSASASASSANSAASSASQANASKNAAATSAANVRADADRIESKLDDANAAAADIQSNMQAALVAADQSLEFAGDSERHAKNAKMSAQLAVAAQKDCVAERQKVDELGDEFRKDCAAAYEHLEELGNGILYETNSLTMMNRALAGNISQADSAARTNALRARLAADMAIVAQKDCLAERVYIEEYGETFRKDIDSKMQVNNDIANGIWQSDSDMQLYALKAQMAAEHA